MSRVTTMNAIEIKQMRINYWLRYHIEYQVMIRLCTRYVCIEVQVTRREWDSQNHKFKEKYLKRWLGNSLEELLDELIAYLKIDEWEGKYKWWKPLSE